MKDEKYFMVSAANLCGAIGASLEEVEYVAHDLFDAYKEGFVDGSTRSTADATEPQNVKGDPITQGVNR